MSQFLVRATIHVVRIRRMFAVSIIAPLLFAQQAVRRMAHWYDGAGGSIINISSASVQLDSPNEYVDYAAWKGALETFTTGSAKEITKGRVRGNCARTGHIYPEMHASGGRPDKVDQMTKPTPMRRSGQPEKVAEAVLWLARAAASVATGTFIDVTSGM